MGRRLIRKDDDGRGGHGGEWKGNGVGWWRMKDEWMGSRRKKGKGRERCELGMEEEASQCKTAEQRKWP